VRSGLTLWDDTGCWQGMPTRLEQAVYGGLTPAHMHTLAHQAPTTFSGPEAAIAWGFEQGCFKDAAYAVNAYAKVKREQAPKTAAAMWQVWIEEVARRKQAGEPGRTDAGAAAPSALEPASAVPLLSP
jgi:hypothetical protein